MQHISKQLIISISLLFLLAATELSASTIGAFQVRANTSGPFNLIDGTLMGRARNALVADGHTFQNLDTGIDAAALATVDILYLNVSNVGGAAVLTGAEASAIATWVNAGGVLIVQGDAGGFGTAYNDIAGLLGVQYTGGSGDGGVDDAYAITTAYSRLTDGPHGTVSTVSVGATGVIDPGASSGVSLRDNPTGSFLYVLAPDTGFSGSGTAVFLTDVNTFDGPGNTDGFIEADGEALWRNMFALDGNAPPPVLTYTVGGAVTGLTGSVTLQNNGGDDIIKTTNDGFTFPAQNEGTDYAVTVSSQPTGQTCTVTNGSGTNITANITNVAVDCVDDSTPPPPTGPATPIPTMSVWGLGILIALMGLIGFNRRRKM